MNPVSRFLLSGVLLACALGGSGASYAQARPKNGLVLSGGGSRGLGHVGVHKVLER